MANEKASKPKDAPEKKEAVLEAPEAKGVGTDAPAVVVQEPVIPAKPEIVEPAKPESPVIATSAPRFVIRCPKCNSVAGSFAGGKRHCNQCGYSWE
jgi:hypothetical protein